MMHASQRIANSRVVPAAQRAFHSAVRSPTVNPIAGPAGAAPTPHQRLTLIPVEASAIDEERFVTSDLKTVRKYWDKVFLGNTVSESIYKAIAAKGGTADVEAQRETVSSHYSDVDVLFIQITNCQANELVPLTISKDCTD